MRQMRGLELARTSRIKRVGNQWKVPSQSGGGYYTVKLKGHKKTCDCPDCRMRNVKCKHIWAVELLQKQTTELDGRVTTTKRMRVTYSQDWKAYNKAQCNEQETFMDILNELCQQIDEPEYKFGRPRMLLSDMIFTSALKVYSTFSLRRFQGLMRIAHEKEQIRKTCSYVTVSNYMRNPELTPVLQKLIKLSSLPLVPVEKDFAIDSSGFATSRFARYFSFKHGRDTRYRVWIKAHICCGVKTQIITGVELTEGEANDCPYFKPLVEKNAENFQIREMSADKAYASRDNYNLVDKLGAIPFIPFKRNASRRAKCSRAWAKMYHWFHMNQEDFLEHYHKRSNSETAFHMIKSKFRDNVRSKDRIAQYNEVLLKVLCHNICVLIQEMHELGIDIRHFNSRPQPNT